MTVTHTGTGVHKRAWYDAPGWPMPDTVAAMSAEWRARDSAERAAHSGRRHHELARAITRARAERYGADYLTASREYRRAVRAFAAAERGRCPEYGADREVEPTE